MIVHPLAAFLGDLIVDPRDLPITLRRRNHTPPGTDTRSVRPPLAGR